MNVLFPTLICCVFRNPQNMEFLLNEVCKDYFLKYLHKEWEKDVKNLYIFHMINSLELAKSKMKWKMGILKQPFCNDLLLSAAQAPHKTQHSLTVI